jgi:hypothetical protein
MTSIGDQYLNAAASEDDRLWGEPITYHRGVQSIAIAAAIRGLSEIEERTPARDDMAAELHYVTWTFAIADLSDLVGDPGTDPDWIEDADGNRFDVESVTGDQDWDYVDPERTRVMVRTSPAEE